MGGTVKLLVTNITEQIALPNMERTGGRITSALDWSIKPSERSNYEEIFSALGPEDHKLSGNKVKPVMMNSKLPLETLGKIWDLSDIDQDGFLDKDEFVLAMHLVYKAVENVPVPPTLPPDLIPISKRRKSPYGAIQPLVLPDLLPGLDGQDSSSRSSTPTVDVALKNATNKPTTPWIVNAAEKTRYDEIFRSLDQDRDGFVLGGDVKGVFLQSGLPQILLAHVWNLCDINCSGKLNSEQFALAMHMIYQKLQGGDIPTELTPDMVPPSLRSQPDDSMSPSIGTPLSTGSKELNTLMLEVSELQKTKQQLEVDVAQKDSQIKSQQTELKTLENEISSLTLASRELESEKMEIVKQLDILTSQRTSVESSLIELKEKLEEENNQVEEMKSQLQEQEKSLEDQELALNEKRHELNELRQEETSLQKQITDGQNRLDSLFKTVKMTQSEIDQTKKTIEHLRQQQLKMNEVIAEFHIEGSFNVMNNGCVQVAPISITEVDGQQLMAEEDPFGKLETSFHVDDPFKALKDSSRKEDVSKAEDSKDQATASFQKPPDLSNKVEDIFKQEDFFSEFTEPVKKNEDSFDSGFNGFSSDPFGNEDPFKEDPFKDSGIIESTPSDPFGGDPFQEEFTGRKDSNKADPFECFPNDAGTTDITDLFDPFGLSNTSSSVTAEDKFHEECDPFGTDPFSAFSGPESPIPALPPRKSKAPPPRPVAPKHGVNAAVTSTAQENIHNEFDDNLFDLTVTSQSGDLKGDVSDPFDSLFSVDEKPSVGTIKSVVDPFDPFGIGCDPFSNSTDAQEEFANFADFDKVVGVAVKQKFVETPSTTSPSQPSKPNLDTLTEEEQLAWVTQESLRLEEARQRAEAQEQAELELALALSRKET
ncbi:epidermal growth factor receptor substrate 15-like 1 isoform X2 [Limulus polyphemus]|uniref:Epidermal growth factor receptor substrate 15-like 1 isoform X2 n=1 Tax=Limulus polyphemus TaxID=6850 RepID=A0ABM1S1P9_LIMPO|nr:epidermal growth factor receptor substrate 15-like 1 isoform X2 [Limulus polyphemus]